MSKMSKMSKMNEMSKFLSTASNYNKGHIDEANSKYKQKQKKSEAKSDLLGLIPSPSGVNLSNIKKKFIGFFVKIIDFFRKMIVTILVPVVRKVDAQYPKVLYVLYFIRLLFAIFIIAIVIWSSISGGSGTATPLYHVYSILKSVFVILMLIAGFFVVVFAVKDADQVTNPSDRLPTEISVLYSFLYLTPYMYDLVAILILLGILKAYYIRGCSSGDVKKNPNVYNFVDIIV